MELTIALPNRYDPQEVEAPTEKGQVFLYKDGMAPFLRLKVTQSSRSWQFDSVFHGKHVKRKIGNVHLLGVVEARLRSFDLAKQLSEGVEPPTLNERKKQLAAQRLTVGAVFEQYFEQHASTCDSAGEMWRGYKAYWDTIKNIVVCQLEADHIQTWINFLAKDRGKATAAKQFTALRASLRYAIQRKIAPVPKECLVGIKTPKTENSIQYLKPGDEVERLFAALELESPDVRESIRMMLWTGQRKSNVLSMQWSEVDFEVAVWVIPPSKTKTKKQYCIALTPRAMELLRSRREYTEGDYVFPCVRNSNTRHLRHINKAWLRIRERAGLGKLRPHDLRHTVATWLAMSGANAHVIQQALQHASLATSQRYVHMAPSAVRDAQSKAQEMMMGMST